MTLASTFPVSCQEYSGWHICPTLTAPTWWKRGAVEPTMSRQTAGGRSLSRACRVERMSALLLQAGLRRTKVNAPR
ncbi:hypothetical protein GN956_G13434 [Arapaima gigas]